jgi:hypothetical protein
MNKGKGISEHKNLMFLNETLTEIPIPTKKTEEIRTKNAHNNLPDYDIKAKKQFWGRPEMFVIHIIKHKTLNFALMTTLMVTNTKICSVVAPPRIKFLCNIS